MNFGAWKRVLPSRKAWLFVLIMALIGGVLASAYAAAQARIFKAPSTSRETIADIFDNSNLAGDNGPAGDATLDWPAVWGGTGDNLDNRMNAFVVRPHPAYNENLWLEIDLVERGGLNKYYTSLTETVGIYTADNSDHSAATWTLQGSKKDISLVGGPVTFIVGMPQAENGIAVVVEDVNWYAKEDLGDGNYPGATNMLNVEEAPS